MHSFNSCLGHCIWSTKNRTPFLTSDLRERLWPYLRGIAKQNKMKPLAVGGAADHVHMLIALPAALSVAKAIQLLKGNSSKWIHEAFPKMRSFEWQEGYGAFQHRRVRYRNHCGVYSEPDGASSQSGISRRVSGH